MKSSIRNIEIGLLLVFLITSCSRGTSVSKNDDGKEEQDTDTTSVDSNIPPRIWQEHWFEHDQFLQRVFYNDQVAVYYGPNIDKSITWPGPYFTKVWKYIKSVYGNYGDENRLYVVMHTDTYSGGHPSTYMDVSHDYRNVIDIAPYDWTEKNPNLGLNIAIHELGHIVEGVTNGILHNPAWNIWKDSKWAEIFIYDVYKNTGTEQFAAEWFNAMTYQYDDWPRENTQWFMDWFYPIYHQYGGDAVLNNFYDLLAAYFPKNEEENVFSRRMNWGEFIHFWSGAAGKDLKPLAKEAFGWSLAWEYELQQARNNFPDLSYNIEATMRKIVNVSTAAQITVSAENTDGPASDEGSLKLIDNKDFTKFFLGGYSPDFWAQQLFSEAKTINAYLLTSGNDYASRDPKSWKLKGSNDGESWTVIDTQKNVNFKSRNQTKAFKLDTEVSYGYYCLVITANAGSADFQLSEWRLINVK